VTVNRPRGRGEGGHSHWRDAGAGQVQGGGMSIITQTQRTQAPHPNDCCMVLTSLTRPDQLNVILCMVIIYSYYTWS
jgi:hypothetical protein